MNFRSLLIVPPLVIGVVGFIWLNSQKAPDTQSPLESRLAVRVQQTIAKPVSTSVVGYGRVSAEHSWSAIAEVEGRVIEVAADIDVGSIVEEGQLLVAIDQTDYKIAQQKARANIASVKAQLAELDRQEENTNNLLEVELRILTVAQAEFDRASQLREREVGTQASLDTAQKTLFSTESSVTGLKNTLALYPSQRDDLNATLAVRQAELAEAERSLEKSTIVAPYRGRVSEMSAEVGQFVGTGDKLITLESTDAAEIIAEIQPQAFGSLILPALGSSLPNDGNLESSQFVEILNRIGITATVNLTSDNVKGGWEGEIVRQRGSMDDETSAMGIVVRVDDPLIARPDLGRPPLHVGSFVQVTFTAKPKDDVVVIPRSTIHLSDQGKSHVYLSNAEDELEIRNVTLGVVLGDDVIVEEGLEGGEMLILSRPNPTVPGMKLTPVSATTAAQDS